MKKYWLMAFRVGPNGLEVWPDCYERGIAALSYYLNGELLPDLSTIKTREEYNEIWKQRKDRGIPSRNSLGDFRYGMEKGDIIYARQGMKIVGKGVIKSDYKYDLEILKGCKICEWEHYREVNWERDFQRFDSKLPPWMGYHTVLGLKEPHLDKISLMESKELKKIKIAEAKEGKRYKAETIFRERNRALIEAKKVNSNYRCEVCEMSFKDVYGEIGNRYIIAHHINPIGNRKRASKTTLDYIALVCSNCHDMLHRKDPPYELGELLQVMGKVE